MSSNRLPVHAEAFRSAVEQHDFVLAGQALQEYIACFRSGTRTAQEIEDAKHLFEWGVQITRTHEARLPEELMLLKRVFNAYGAPRRVHTWRLEG